MGSIPTAGSDSPTTTYDLFSFPKNRNPVFRKRCSRCETYKPQSAFNENQPYCRVCQKAYHRKWYRQNKRKRITYIRDWQRANIERKRAASRRWYQRHPDKIRAQSLARAADARGEIPKTPCVICGATENLQLHHPDYNRPLWVFRLCIPCHSAVDCGDIRFDANNLSPTPKQHFQEAVS